MRLRELSDRPKLLNLRGALGEREVSVAIVGARAASTHGMAVAERLAGGLGSEGARIVSGGALGIDAAAHRGAIGAGAPTLAVLATGLDVSYPARNRPLFERMVDAGGGLVSQFPAGAPPRGGQFVRRNRTIAGLADMVVLIDAGASSGALHTARAATDYGRVLGAVPGAPGCEALIAQGAALVESVEDVWAALGGSPRRPVVDLPSAGSEEHAVLVALSVSEPCDTDQLAARAGLDSVAISRALTGLELEGLAVLLPGRRYVRSMLAEQLLG